MLHSMAVMGADVSHTSLRLAQSVASMGEWLWPNMHTQFSTSLCISTVQFATASRQLPTMPDSVTSAASPAPSSSSATFGTFRKSLPSAPPYLAKTNSLSYGSLRGFRSATWPPMAQSLNVTQPPPSGHSALPKALCASTCRRIQAHSSRTTV
jgi:hypothetical protein